jgi:hypothetical protein
MSDYPSHKDSSLKTLNVTVENLASSTGTAVSQFWFGFHDGSFTIFDSETPASPALERLAEDGNTGPLTNEFSRSSAGIVQGTVFGSDDVFNNIFPGSSTSFKVLLDTSHPGSRYFSYAAMVIPSNDAFIANEGPKAHEVIDCDGNFVGADIIVMGSEVRDAGTEVNDEAPLHAAGAGPIFVLDAGVAEKGVVHAHEGYKPGGTILSLPMWAQADFTTEGYRVARITVTEADG